MRKFINLAKKQLLVITAALFIAFTIMLIVLSCLPRGNKYEYDFEAMGITMEIDYTFDDDELTMDAYIMGEYTTGETEYKINDGDLYIINVETKTWQYVGEINAYEIVMIADAEETGIGEMRIVLECKLTKALRTVAIVFMSISGVLALCCIVIYLLDKKGLLKFIDKQSIVSDNVVAVANDNPEQITAETQEVNPEEVIEEQENVDTKENIEKND